MFSLVSVSLSPARVSLVSFLGRSWLLADLLPDPESLEWV